MSAGDLLEEDAEKKYVVYSEFDDINELNDVIIRSGFTGNRVVVSDVADIIDGFEKPETIVRYNGNDAINIVVYKKSEADMFKMKKELNKIIDDFKSLYGDDLISIILYGSASGKEFRPGKSDINFMIVLSEEGIEHLDKAFKTVAKWKKKRVAIPLFLTQVYLETSMDVFPIEYLNFQRNHTLIYGEDILKDLNLSDKTRITALNKTDLLLDSNRDWDTESAITHLTDEYGVTDDTTVLISSTKGWGLTRLLELISRTLSKS